MARLKLVHFLAGKKKFRKVRHPPSRYFMHPNCW